jgi:hypothetical protein
MTLSIYVISQCQLLQVHTTVADDAMLQAHTTVAE